MKTYQNYFFDLDGVIYRGNERLPGAREFIEWIEATGRTYLYLSNNSMSTPAQVAARLEAIGMPAPLERVVTAGSAAAAYLGHTYPGARAFVLGLPPLAQMVAAAGLHPLSEAEGAQAEVVLVGLDRKLTYARLSVAVQAVLNGAAFVTVNRDPLLPVEDKLEPGAGSIAAALEASTGVSPYIVGKPEPGIILEALRLIGGRAEETVMIGDGITLDIPAGHNAGLDTILLLSGITPRAQLAAAAIQPDAVYEDLAHLLAETAEVRPEHR
ncbi:MAG TPA: HAD-IIA family hydrolase [Ktedonobacterales bacterium]|jgi:HAD superfamily hydrolase (TIGR01457 family)